MTTQIKLPKKCKKENICRRDKMVMYFYDKDEQKALQFIEDIYHSHKDYFNSNGTPRFSEELTDSNGEKMDGVGFGQEPDQTQGGSFGSNRSTILTEVFWAAKNSGHQISDPDFDFNTSFNEACIRHKVNPNNPAFNLNDEYFKLLIKRIA